MKSGDDIALGGTPKIALAVFVAALLAFLYLPIVLLLVFSFNDSTIIAFPLRGFTTRWYAAMAQNHQLVASLEVSFRVALLAAVGTEVIALNASIVVARRRFPGKPALMALFLAPMLIPALTIGVSLLLLFHILQVPLSLITIAVGHMVVAFPYALLVLVPRVQRIDQALEEAAADLGASAWQTLRRITLPLLAPGVISSFLVIFTISFDEYAVASFLAGREQTLPIYMFNLFKLPDLLPQVVGVAVVIMVASLLLIVAAELGRRLVERRLESASAA